MTPIEEIRKISHNLEQILQNQYGANGRGLREKADSVADLLPEDTLRKISKLAAIHYKITHENITFETEKMAAFRQLAGEVYVSLMLYKPFEPSQTAAGSEDQTPRPEDADSQSSASSQKPGPLWTDDETFSWAAFYSKILPDTEQYMRELWLYHELQKDYSPTSQKVQEIATQMLSTIGRLYGLYEKTLQKRQKDLQTLIDDECRSNSPIMLSTQEDIDKLKSEMLQLQPENSLQGALKCVEVLKWLQAGRRKVFLTADGIKYAFRWCPLGEFMMGGKRSEWDGSKWVEQSDQHRVKLTSGFWLLETEVTQKMWQSVMGENPSHFKGEQNPVEQVSWNACQDFCQKLSQKLDRTVKLPTEAQWEYACRAGTTEDYAGDLDSMAWFGEDYRSGSTHPVAQKQANAWGLYDMHGNIWEWCSDYYEADYYDWSPTSDPKNENVSNRRVCRGGFWSSSAELCRSAFRIGAEPDRRNENVGFRVLLVPSPED